MDLWKNKKLALLQQDADNVHQVPWEVGKMVCGNIDRQTDWWDCKAKVATNFYYRYPAKKNKKEGKTGGNSGKLADWQRSKERDKSSAGKWDLLKRGRSDKKGKKKTRSLLPADNRV